MHLLWSLLFRIHQFFSVSPSFNLKTRHGNQSSGFSRRTLFVMFWLADAAWVIAAREPSIRLLYIYIYSWGVSSVTADSVTCITVLDSPWVRSRREWVCEVPCLTGTKGYCDTHLVGLTAIPVPENIKTTELSNWAWYISPNGLTFHRQL